MNPMIGGAKFKQAVIDWTKQSNQLYLTVATVLIFMWALYAEKLPESWRWQLSTTVGRLLLLLLLYIVNMLAGFLPALLFAVAIALTWANRPLYKPVNVRGKDAEAETEAFNDMKVTQVNSHKWFVEKALNEDPVSISEDRISTNAIQDGSSTSSGRTSR